MGEKDDNTKLTYSIDGKVFKELSEVNGLPESTLETAPLDDFKSVRPQSCSFECKVPPLGLLKIVFGEYMLIRYCQSTKSNNWLRMHGLPMRRRNNNVSGCI